MLPPAPPPAPLPAPPPLSVPCPNCGQALGEPPPRFCPQCGQETRVRPPRIGEFVQQFGGAYLSTEGALWRTLRLLLLRPGELTRQYLAGRRKHYVLPLRLYLTISVVALLLLRLVASASLEPTVKFDSQAELPKSIVVGFGAGRAGLKDGAFFCENLPQWLCARLQRRLAIDPGQIEREVRQFSERFMGNLGAVMFVMLPSFALFMKLAYLNRRLRYTEHLVFALHLHAFWFVAIMLTLPELPWISGLARLSMPVYAALAAHRVYGGRVWPLLLRGAVVGALYGITLVMAMALVALWTFLV